MSTQNTTTISSDLPLITSKAALIGFMEGSIKGLVYYYEDIAKRSKEPHLQAIIIQLKRLLEESAKLWEVVRDK